MTPITKEQANKLADSIPASSYDDYSTFLHLFAQACIKLGRNAGLDEARKLDWIEVMREGSLVTWGDAGTLGYRVVEKLESLKDNTP